MLNSKTKYVFAVICILAFVSFSSGQRSVPVVKVHLPEVPFSQVGWGVAQDEFGMLFLGDRVGRQLLTFDGERWGSIKLSESPLDMASDNSGTVWVGTEQGLGRLRCDKRGRYLFETVPLDIATDVNPILYCSAFLEGCAAFHGEQVCVFCKGGEVDSVHVVEKGSKLVGVDEEHYYVFYLMEKRVKFFDVSTGSSTEINVGERVVEVVVHLGNERWLVWSDKIEVYENGEFSEFSPTLAAMGKIGKHPLFVFPLLDGICVGLQGELLFLEPDGRLRYRLGVNDGMEDSLIARVCADRDGNLWAGHENGVTCIYHSNPVWRLVEEGGDIKGCFRISSYGDRGDRYGFVSRSRMILAEGERTTAWLGLDVFELEHAQRVLFGDRSGVFEIRNGRRHRLAKPHGEFYTGFVGEDVMILGQRGGTYLVVKPNEDGLETLQKIELIPESYVLGMDSDFKVWVEGQGVRPQLLCVDFAAGWDSPPEITESEVPADSDYQVSGGRTLSYREAQGFVMLSLKAGSVSHEVIPAVEMNGKGLDQYQTQWLGQDQHVVAVPLHESLVNCGLPTRKWRFPEDVRAVHFNKHKGQIYAAGKNAVYARNVDTEIDRALTPPMITVRVSDSQEGTEVAFGNADVKSELLFQFSTRSYNHLESTEYRYRLKGLEPEFTAWDSRSEVKYSRLPVGNYVFQVEARRPDDEVVSAETETIRIPASSYHSWWAILGYFLAMSIFVWWLFSLRYKNIAKRRRRLEQVVREQTRQLQEQSTSLQQTNQKLRSEIQAVKESERRRSELEDRLLESERLESLGQLAGGIAHDFNNMLSVVMTNAELMEDLNHEQEECREQIISISQQAAELCNQMLMVSGGGTVDIQVHDLNDIVRKLSNLLESTVQPLRLELEFSAESLPVEVDRSQITQLVLNLVANAADATRSASGTRVCVNSGADMFTEEDLRRVRSIDFVPAPGKYAWLSVSDQGRGIEPETRRRMFDPFFSTKSHGRGLGLATVIRVVSRHFGAVSVDTTINQGTCMKILLPMSSEVAEAKVLSSQPDDASTSFEKQSRILLIDDDDAIRAAMSRMLLKAGFECESFDNGKEGIVVAQENRFAAAIVDLSMPGMSGVDVIRELRALDAELPVVVISGFSIHNTTSGELPAYKTRFLGKPFSRSDLIDRLRELLDEEPSAV